MILALLALAAPQASAAQYVIARAQCATGACTLSYDDAWILGYTATPTLTTSRTSAGVYTFSMTGVGSTRGNVQVVAAGSAATTCAAGTWSATTTGLNLGVRCFSATGAAKDSDFILYYQDHGTAAWSNTRAAAAHVATTATSIRQSTSSTYNSTGATNTLSKTSTGTYAVVFPGMTSTNATLMLSTTGGSANRCRISSFTASATAGASIGVICTNTSGTVTDTGFSLSYTQGDQAHGAQDDLTVGWGAWTTVSSTAGVSGCTNRSAGSTSSTSCDITATKPSTGKYTVHIPYQDWQNSAPFVSSYSSSAGFCTLEDWDASTTTGGVDVKVNCYNSSGTLTNTRFSLSYNTWYSDYYSF